MIRNLSPLVLALLLIAAPARADWGTSTAQPDASAPFVCWLPGDGADLRGQNYVCWWEPEGAQFGWGDALGRRVDWCAGDPQTGDLDIVNTYGQCARVHGLVSTDAQPLGFRAGWQYVRWAGWYGLLAGTSWSETQIASYRLGPNTHVTLCAGDLAGPVNDPCRGSTQQYVISAGSVVSGIVAVPLVVHGFSVGTNAAPPPACALTPQKWVACTTRDKSGLPVTLAGDGFPRVNGYAVLGNPITGPNGVPCLGHDAAGTPAVFVYPLPGTPTTNPDGTPAFTPVCPQ